jgi:tight adherence protein B
MASAPMLAAAAAALIASAPMPAAAAAALIAPAPILAAAAAALAVGGTWDLLAAVERTRPAAVLAQALEPVVRAGREGRTATVPERRRLALLAAAALAAAGWLVGGALLGLLAAVTGPALTISALRARRRVYSRALERGAAGAARAIADALAGGHAIRGAIAAAGEGMPSAAGVELRRTAGTLALGEPTDAALEELRRRAAAPAWDAIVTGIELQRAAGGDLAALLRDLAEAVEAAERAERDARAATAQARATARIVVGLPLAAAVLAELAAPGFAGRLLARPASAALVILAAALQLAALVAMRRLARVP